jgi:hypothetical protein
MISFVLAAHALVVLVAHIPAQLPCHSVIRWIWTILADRCNKTAHATRSYSTRGLQNAAVHAGYTRLFSHAKIHSVATGHNVSHSTAHDHYYRHAYSFSQFGVHRLSLTTARLGNLSFHRPSTTPLKTAWVDCTANRRK